MICSALFAVSSLANDGWLSVDSSVWHFEVHLKLRPDAKYGINKKYQVYKSLSFPVQVVFAVLVIGILVSRFRLDVVFFHHVSGFGHPHYIVRCQMTY